MNLTARQRQVIALMADGCSREQIAQRLFIDVKTVRTHLWRIYKITGAASHGNPGWWTVAQFVRGELR